ncbi:MAG: hypothetical protein A2W31_12140 [Planctomycetes bacterium RBG_16_64_10]|nr:MAG: hypothetical protein A2W31_12140 [Planctomycetes bacterium RBG_16_64_10]
MAGLLVLIGAGCLALRLHPQNQAPIARGDSVWRLTYHIGFRADAPGARVWVAFPQDTPHARVYRQRLRHSEMRTERLRSGPAGSRAVTAVTHRAGAFQLRAECDIHLSQHASWRPGTTATVATVDARAKLLQSEKTIQLDSPAVRAVLDQLGTAATSQTDLVERLFEYCVVHLRVGGEDAPNDAAAALQQGVATWLGRARAMVALCRAGKIPARLVTGFELCPNSNAQPHVWVEVRADDQWQPYDLENGFARELPHHFVPVQANGTRIVRATGVGNLRVDCSIVRLPPTVGAVNPRNGRLADVVDLTRLPLDMHEVLALLLLLPFGAVVTVVFRTIVGIQTFGTFTPTLLAMSFVYADWRTGLAVFAAVLALGLASRALLDRLELLMVPRLSVVLTLVVLCMVFGVSALDHFQVTPSPQAVLLPMVILTMTVERFYLTTVEDSIPYALQLLGGTLIVAFFCFLVLRWAEVGWMILRFPEIHFFTVAALILLGRYTGYRMTELRRFRSTADSDTTLVHHSEPRP